MNNNLSELPKILSLKPNELIDWCNNRKKEMHLSNAKLSELTNVPEGTLDRIFTGKNPEFRYSTIQPIVALLIGINNDIPENESSEFYTDTIEGYKLVVENKNNIIEKLKESYEQLQEEIKYLRNENKEKHEIIIKMQEHTEWMEQMIDSLKEHS